MGASGGLGYSGLGEPPLVSLRCSVMLRQVMRHSLSIAAHTESMENWTGGYQTIVRSMALSAVS
jgi:hypothetical protein